MADDSPLAQLHRDRDFTRLRIQAIERDLDRLHTEREHHLNQLAELDRRINTHEQQPLATPHTAHHHVRLARQRLEGGDE